MEWVNVSECNGQVTLAISECELILFLTFQRWTIHIMAYPQPDLNVCSYKNVVHLCFEK